MVNSRHRRFFFKKSRLYETRYSYRDDALDVDVFKFCGLKRVLAGGIFLSFDRNVYRITYFSIDASDRGIGLSHDLIKDVIFILKRRAGHGVIVTVHPRVDDDSVVRGSSIEEQSHILYNIYEHLGFKLKDSSADRHKANHEMTMEIS